MTEYSVVIPMKNEEENILPLLKEVKDAMEPLNSPWEVICIDDGSDDKTLERLQLAAKDFPLKIISFDQNYGQSAAFDAGFKAAAGKWIITLDGDRQNDPADIPKLLAVKEDSDLVGGIRQKRKDSSVKKLTSYFANKVRQRVCRDGMEDSGCSLKVFRKSALEQIKLFQGMHRFFPALFIIEGFKVKQIPVSHRARAAGVSHYSFWNRNLNTISDLIAVYWMRKRALKYKRKP